MSTSINRQNLLNQAALLAADLYAARVLSEANSLSELPYKEVAGLDAHEVAETEVSVNKELENIQVRKAICAALESANNDVRDIAKLVGAALLPLSLSGVVAIPLTPLAFGVAGLIVFNAGVSAFCSSVTLEKKD